ncbi:hypothetical protein ACQP2T_19190 [Nonomuraea sp. CA-143628]|uniref:hypothetical protein n=1 Tax=Nonomuraea sp. CA-143628 TaxID=3239997 RepID=UPI003D8F3940
MADLIERKLRHFFELMDRDGSATLELADYLTAADGVSASFGLTPGSPEYEAVRETFRRFWEDVVQPMDTDDDAPKTCDCAGSSSATGRSSNLGGACGSPPSRNGSTPTTRGPGPISSKVVEVAIRTAGGRCR